MGLFDDISFVTVKPGVQAEPSSPAPDEILRGSFWSLFDRKGVNVVKYVSGELAGRAKVVAVSRGEGAQLTTGDDETAIRIIGAHGGS